MRIGEEFPIFNWFKIHFVENEGIAFGIKMDFSYGKPLLTIFRIIVSIVIFVFLFFKLKRLKVSKFFNLGLILIFSGAVGNIIDSIFYGVLFSDSFYSKAVFLPNDGGYAPLLWGKVVDMLYFPISNINIPNFVPFLGGETFLFFSPVFNLADSYLTVGMVLFILFSPKK